MSDAWTLETVLKLRDEIQARDLAAPMRDERHHDAAALLSSFEIAPGIHTGVAAANLIADSVLVKEGSNRWTLKNSVRRRILKQLHTREALQEALRKTTDRPDDRLQHAIEACLAGSMKSLGEQTSDELAASLQVVDWLGGTDLKDSLPPLDAIRERVEYAALVDPLRALAGSNFYGRKTELAALANYVTTDNEVDESDQPPMLIFGPGGMGKSALIAKFVLDRIGQLPIVYLDCDRPGLAPQEPVTFVAEAVRQLGLQFDRFRSSAEHLRGEWLRAITLAQTSDANTRGRTVVLDEFRVFINDIGLGQSTVFFAIDTFEEVQYRSRSIAREVAVFLNELRERLPRLRAVIAGRNPTSDFVVTPLELGELDQEASQSLLASVGVESSELQSRLARLLHGNPLSLRLAAEILKTDDSKGWAIEHLTDDTSIQGVLYGRILGHIHQDDVRKIAHPGLILRRITANLIRDVLAKPCGVQLDDPKYADTLFHLLRNELSLVIPEGDAVRHRPDVRRVMLEPLRNDRKDVVRQIEEEAVKYYTPFDDLTSRAEEIYHRLSLGQSREEIDLRWLPGIEDSLRSAVEELPKSARTYIANRLRFELYDQDWDSVDQKTWEEYAARQSEDLLQLDRPLEAVRLLRHRSARLPGSPLYWLQAQALRRGGQVLESREVARQAIEQMVTDFPVSVQLLDWFAGPKLPKPPSSEDVHRQLAQFDILRPLRALAGGLFVGREPELRALSSYVFARGLTSRPLLMISGPGGMGKSALVAKFILDRLGDLDPIYINWSSLSTPPWTPEARLNRLWAEVYRQLYLTRPELRFGTAEDQAADHEWLRKCFGMMGDIARPLLMVIDGIEELQFRDGSEAERLYAILGDFQAVAPRLRVILVSRVRPTSPKFEVLELTGLPAEAAEAFLQALSIEPIEARHKVLELAGSTPLTLKLAAEVVRQSGAESLNRIPSETDIAPYLLNRILSHIANHEMRSLARGALAVRRVTTEVVEYVLASPCQLIVETHSRAEELLDLLVRETSLFTQAGPGVLRPRPDLRQIFRKSIATAQMPVARAIDEAAVAYYQSRDEPEFRAEEIFHRIMLGQTPEEIDGRWIDGIEPFLQDINSEVAGPVSTYLAVRLGLELLDIGNADQATWEIYVAKRTKTLMDMGKHLEALELVRQRSTRMRRSPLFAIEAQILLVLARAREALVVGRRGLELWPDDTKLAFVVSAAERALGPDETSQQQPVTTESTLSQGAFYLLTDVGGDEVLAELRSVLLTSTDVMNAFRSIQGLPAKILIDLESIVAWASTSHRLDELVTAAAIYAPTDPSLAAFLVKHAKRVEASGSDPIARVLLQRGEVFFDRQVLRDFLRVLISGEARSRVLVVNGPSGSGKSYTGVLANSLAHATGRVDYRRFDLSQSHSVVAFIRSIFDAFQWRSDLVLPPTSEPLARSLRELADVIRRKAQESRTTVLLHIDIPRDPRSETVDFLGMLVEDPGSLALMLSGFSKDWVPVQAQRDVVFETTADLSVQDIEDGIARIFRELNRPVAQDEADRVAQTIVDAASPAPNFNATVNRSVKKLIAGLTG
jgi:hypothetical protein